MEEKIENLFKGYGITEVDKKLYKDLCLNIWWLVSPAYSNVDDSHNENHIFHVLRRSIDLVFWLKNRSRNFNHDKETKYIMKVILASFIHDVFSYNNRKYHHEKAYLLIRKICDIKVLEQNNTLNVKDKAIEVVNKMFEVLNLIPGQVTSAATKKFEWLKWYSKYDLLEVSEMVNEHRASYEGKFSSELCELFSTADRDDLDLNVVINRIYVYAKDKTNRFNCDINGFLPLDITINQRSYHTEEIIPYLKNSLEWNDEKVKTFYHLWEKFSKVGYMYNSLKIDGIFMLYYKDQITKFYNDIDAIIENPEEMLKYIKID